jgi:hypothetical protein
VPSNPLLNSLLGAYSDDDEDESESKEKIAPQKPSSSNMQYNLPGTELAFAPIKIDDKMDEELKRFMAEIG